MKKKQMNMIEKYQYKIALGTLKLSDFRIAITDGMTKDEATNFIERMKKEGKI